eukprot:3193-Heterococcus_DN1.PRE.4
MVSKYTCYRIALSEACTVNVVTFSNASARAQASVAALCSDTITTSEHLRASAPHATNGTTATTVTAAAAITELKEIVTHKATQDRSYLYTATVTTTTGFTAAATNERLHSSWRCLHCCCCCCCEATHSAVGTDCDGVGTHTVITRALLYACCTVLACNLCHSTAATATTVTTTATEQQLSERSQTVSRVTVTATVSLLTVTAGVTVLRACSPGVSACCARC